MSQTAAAAPPPVDAAEAARRPARLFDLVMAAFVTVLLLSNVIGAGKLAVIEVRGWAPCPSARGSCSSRSPM
jgi:hypothetical protein